MANIYWDSCVAIYRVENVSPWATTVIQWLAALEPGSLLHVSDLTRMECRLAPLRAGNDELLKRYDDFSLNPIWPSWICRVPCSTAPQRCARRIG